MKKSANKTIFFVIILAIIIVVIGIYFGKGEENTPTANNNSDSSVQSQSQSDSEKNAFKGSIVYLVKSTNGSDIYKSDMEGNAKKVYTDSDESLKIKSAYSMNTSGKILAVLAPAGQEFGGSLFLIDSNNPGQKEKIIDQFASTQAPILSPNGKKIAYTIFSNTEADYGFSLYVMNIDGSNKQKISTDQVSVKILSWNSDSNKIAYLKGDNFKESVIYSADLNAHEQKIISFKEKIYSLNWHDDNFVLSKGSGSENELNKAEIYKLGSSGKNLKRLTTDDTHDDFCLFSPTGQGVVFLSASYDKNVDITKSGEITLLNIEDNKSKKLIEANYIIGWIE